MNGKYDHAEWKIRPRQELNYPSLQTPVENLRKWVISSNEQKTYVSGFYSSYEKICGPNPTTMMELHRTHIHYIHNLNMAPSSKPPLCDVIYVYCNDTFQAVENQEEVERSVHA